MKLSNNQIIINFLQDENKWVPLWNLIKVNTKWGWLGTSARSRVQELAQAGKIYHKLGSKDDPELPGKFSWYKAKPVVRQFYKVLGDNGEVEKVVNYPATQKLQTNLF